MMIAMYYDAINDNGVGGISKTTCVFENSFGFLKMVTLHSKKKVCVSCCSSM